MIKKPYYDGKQYFTIRDILDSAVKEAPNNDAYLYRIGRSEEIHHVTFYKFNEDTENLGAALTDLGFGSSHIACMSENRYEWIVAYLTVLKSAGVFVPVDKELPTDGKLNVINDSESSVLFFSGKYASWVHDHRDDLPNIKLLICFDDQTIDDSFVSYRSLIEKGSHLSREEYDSLSSDEYDMKLLVYTSGTTGIAKGVMLTEHNICSLIYYGLELTGLYDRGLSVLPYHHTYEAVTDIIASIRYHSTLCINNSLKDIVKDLQLYKPSYIFIVPALGEFLITSIQKNIKKQGKEKEFKAAVRLSKTFLALGIDMRPYLFQSLRNVFGGRMTKIICGGAPIRPELGEFFEIIGIYLIGGYGITECSPLVSVNDEKTVTYTTVGHRLKCLKWRIEEPNEDGIGEICVKGDTVMKGYFKNPAATEEAIVDGWFHTGDYGYLDDKDQLIITGRKKNIIVLSNGKNIYPEEIENYIMNVPYIEEVVVRGIKNEKGEEYTLGAEVYLSSDVDESTVLSDIQSQLKELPNYKLVTQVKVRKEPFEKTSTNKIKRNA
ncbi:MAG: AMP-binding protein [Oscillospiraceae bacterium]|nr:AMP-binding protein [Oscillospiraceae bacterium]